MGKKRVILKRSKHARVDGPEVQRLIGSARKAVFDGTSFKNPFFENCIGEKVIQLHCVFDN